MAKAGEDQAPCAIIYDDQDQRTPSESVRFTPLLDQSYKTYVLEDGGSVVFGKRAESATNESIVLVLGLIGRDVVRDGESLVRYCDSTDRNYR